MCVCPTSAVPHLGVHQARPCSAQARCHGRHPLPVGGDVLSAFLSGFCLHLSAPSPSGQSFTTSPLATVSPSLTQLEPLLLGLISPLYPPLHPHPAPFPSLWPGTGCTDLCCLYRAVSGHHSSLQAVCVPAAGAGRAEQQHPTTNRSDTEHQGGPPRQQNLRSGCGASPGVPTGRGAVSGCRDLGEAAAADVPIASALPGAARLLPRDLGVSLHIHLPQLAWLGHARHTGAALPRPAA